MYTPWVKDVPYWLQGRNVEVTMHLKWQVMGNMIPAHHFPFTPNRHETSNKHPVSQGCVLSISRSKGQGHNVLITEDVLVHDCCFLVSPISMEVHTQTSHESKVCLHDFGSKGQGHDALITWNGFRHIAVKPIIAKLHTQSPPWVKYWGKKLWDRVWIGCCVCR